MPENSNAALDAVMTALRKQFVASFHKEPLPYGRGSESVFPSRAREQAVSGTAH